MTSNFLQQPAASGQVFDVGSLTRTEDRDESRRGRAVEQSDWADIYSTCSGDLFGFLARRVGRDLAEDLLAETFATAMATSSNVDPAQGTIRTWLFGIASNLVRRHWRTEERRLRAAARDAAEPDHPIDPLLTTAVIDARIDAASDVDALVDELDRLDPIDRELLALTGWESMSSADAGAVLGMNPATVRSRVRRARARLRSATASAPAEKVETKQGGTHR